MSTTGIAGKDVKEVVRDRYGDLAARFSQERGAASCCEPRSCCGPSEARDAFQTGSAAKLYALEELEGLPESVTDITLGCGNPTAIAELQPGQVVLDLGSGGGIDVFLAARKVGPTGKAIGLDMTPDMIKLARQNAKKIGATNVEFRYGEMEDIPLPDESVDVIISNCVINLSPDKGQVFREAHRVLKPGGRLAVSDIVIHGQMPDFIRDSVAQWTGCVAGALTEEDYLAQMRAAGFEDVVVTSRKFADLQELTELPDAQAALAQAPDNFDVKDLGFQVVSAQITARKS